MVVDALMVDAGHQNQTLLSHCQEIERFTHFGLPRRIQRILMFGLGLSAFIPRLVGAVVRPLARHEQVVIDSARLQSATGRNPGIFGAIGVLSRHRTRGVISPRGASGGSRVSFFRYLKRPDMRNRRVYLSAGATAVSRRRCSSPAQRSVRITSATSSAAPSLPSSGKESPSRTTTSFADGTTTTYWPLCPVAAYASVGTPGHMRRDRSSGAPALSHQWAPY